MLCSGTIHVKKYPETSLYPAILSKLFSALQDLSNLSHMLETLVLQQHWNMAANFRYDGILDGVYSFFFFQFKMI